MLKMISQNLELNPPRSPLSDEDLSDSETKEQRQVRFDRELAQFLQRQEQKQAQQAQQQQEQALEHPNTLPLQAWVPTHSQPCPSVVDKYASDQWGDLTGGYSYYGHGGYNPSGEGGSCPAGAPHSEDEDDGEQDDDDDYE